MTKTNFFTGLESKNWQVFLLLFGFAFIMRFHTLFPLTIDYDETTYAVMADHMLGGSVLYKDLIDIKQPGVILIFALIQLLFGKSVVMIRLVATLTVASSAHFLFMTKRRIGFGFPSSLLSAVIFILMFNFYFGFSANTELFFVWCTCLGIYLFFLANNRKLYYLLSGFVLGFGFIIKQHVLFDFAAVGLFFLFTTIRAKSFKSQFLSMGLMVVAFFTPYGLVHLIYYLTGYYEYYHFVSYVAPGNYSSKRDWGVTFKFLKDGIILYLPFFLFGVLSLKSSNWKPDLKLFVGLLLLFDFIAISITGQAHPHYYLQMVLPVAWLAGEVASLGWVQKMYQTKAAQIVTVILLLSYGVFLGFYYHKRYIQRPNKAEDLAVYLKDKIADKSIYTGDAPQFLYWYFDKKSPTPYIHSSLMTTDSHVQTLAFDVKEELMKIYDTEPDLMILSVNYKYKWFKELVERNYTKLEKIHQFEVYVRK